MFKAVSAGGWNLDPLAYGGKPKEGSMYPAQVRVEYCPRCPPMEERYFKPAIADNYFNPNRFRWELSERQVSLLFACDFTLVSTQLQLINQLLCLISMHARCSVVHGAYLPATGIVAAARLLHCLLRDPRAEVHTYIIQIVTKDHA